MTQTLTFPGCWLHIDVTQQFLQTVFPDGTFLTGIPHPEKDRTTAQRYGYGKNWLRLWREHDALHHWVAQQFGLGYSPTIWAECHPNSPHAIPRWARLQEEEFVAHVHRWLNLDQWHDDLNALRECRPNLNALRANALQVLAPLNEGI